MYPTSRATFPRAGILDIPCFSAVSYDGQTAVLQPTGMTVPFDFSSLTPDEFEQATFEWGRDIQIRGLIALDTRWMMALPDVTFRPPYRKPLGVRFDGTWSYAWPLRWDGTLGMGAHTVVRLSN